VVFHVSGEGHSEKLAADGRAIMQIPDSPRLVPAIIIFLSFDVFVLTFVIAALRRKKTVVRQSGRQRSAYMAPLLVGVILLSQALRFVPAPRFMAEPWFPLGQTFAWVAAALAVLGVVMVIWARFALGRNWSGQAALVEGQQLVTAGPYALVRHPIYTALILLFAGFAMLFGSMSSWLGLVLIVWSFWIKLGQEEALLSAEFADSYGAYMATTKRLIPGVI
jgi:protein-S-isoprenylcysteine O-methyltransferase Ste14